MESRDALTTTPSEVVSTPLAIQTSDSSQEAREALVERRLRDRRTALRGELAQRERRVTKAQLGGLAQAAAAASRGGPRRRACAPLGPAGGRRASCGRGSRGPRSRAGSRALFVAPTTARSSSSEDGVARSGRARERRRSSRRPSRRRRRGGRGRGRSGAVRSRRASSTRNSAPASPVARISRCGARGPLTDPPPSSAPRR